METTAPERVSTLELFFDLVFVFTITQVSTIIVEGHDLAAVALALNTRPRKTLAWRTPAEALNDLLRSKQLRSVATID